MSDDCHDAFYLAETGVNLVRAFPTNLVHRAKPKNVPITKRARNGIQRIKIEVFGWS
jgi:hypothetical protein